MYRSTFCVVAGSLLFASAAAAHDHRVIKGNGDIQLLANGLGSHVPKSMQGSNWVICGPAGFDPAWYGLEVAHHGPDAGTPGSNDDCYMIEGGADPATHDGNPAID